MNLDSLPVLYKAGEVRRFHTMRVLHEQNIGEHSWGVCVVLLWLYGDDIPSAALLRAAVLHDTPESHTGDHPGHLKWDRPKLGSELDHLEAEFKQHHGILDALTDDENAALHFADYAEGVWFCITEVTMGNKRMIEPAQRWLQRMYDVLPAVDFRRATYLCENLRSLLEELR